MALGRSLVSPFVLFLIFGDRDGVSAGEPAVEINVGTAARAKRARRLDGGLAANWTKTAGRFGHGRIYGRDAPGGQQVFLRNAATRGEARYTAFSQPKWIG